MDPSPKQQRQPNDRRLVVIAVIVAVILIFIQYKTSFDTALSSPPSSTAAPAAATGLTPAETTQITEQAGQEIANRTYYDTGLGLMSCIQYFKVDGFTLGDVLLQGSQGKVVINYNILAYQPIPHFGGDYFPTQCYGDVPGGWSKSKRATGQNEFKVERWQSGWRLSQQQ